jgi:hypothetical protein
MNRRLLKTGLVVAGVALLAAACGKKDEQKKEAPAAASAKSGEAAAAAPGAAAAPAAEAPPPPPDVGMPFDTFYTARLLERCALKYGVADRTAEKLAIDWTKGVKPAVNLDAVLQKPDAKAKAPEAKDDHEMELAREKWKTAVHLGEAHTATAAKLKDETETCLYAPEVGMIEGKTIETYVRTFVAVTCMQKQNTGDSKGDDLSQAQAAAKIFTDNGMTAGEFSRYGLLFARFPVVIQQAYAARAKACPDANKTAPVAGPPPADLVFNGMVSGDRNASLRLESRAGKLTGAVEWTGVPPPSPDGRPQPPGIIPLTGTMTGKTFTVSGEMQGESFKLTGQTDENGGLTGAWTNTRPQEKDKLKGSFKAEKLPNTTPATAPAIAPK